jgi:hypothetical protein
MNSPESLRARAKALLKSSRIPERGPLLRKAIKSVQLFGPVAHHAAWLRHHANEIERLLKSIPEPCQAAVLEAISQAVSAGRRLALLDELQREKPQTITPEEEAFLTQAVQRRDKTLDNAAKANDRRKKEINAARYDELVAQRKSQEQIAEKLGCSVVHLRSWRKSNSR